MGKPLTNMAFAYGESSVVLQNLREFRSKSFDNKTKSIFHMLGDHSDKIITIDKTFVENSPLEDLDLSVDCDAIFTKLPNVILTMKPADCTVSVIYAQDTNGDAIVGLIHAGRIGLDIQLPTKTIDYLIQELDAVPSTIRIGIAPHISGQSYEILDLQMLTNLEVWDGFITTIQSQIIDPTILPKYKELGYIEGSPLYRLDSTGCILNQYTKAGIKPSQIELYDMDTYQNALIGNTFSHRASVMNSDISNGRFIIGVEIRE
jgi:copper oxidase (laccase) domain-containing protein